jgi:hypothetical protein
LNAVPSARWEGTASITGRIGHDDVANAACGALVLAAIPGASIGIMAHGLAATPLRVALNLTSENSFTSAAEWDYEHEDTLLPATGEVPPWPIDE